MDTQAPATPSCHFPCTSNKVQTPSHSPRTLRGLAPAYFSKLFSLPSPLLSPHCSHIGPLSFPRNSHISSLCTCSSFCRNSWSCGQLLLVLQVSAQESPDREISPDHRSRRPTLMPQWCAAKCLTTGSSWKRGALTCFGQF